MATKKITELNTLTGAGVANGDLLPIVDIGTPNETKAITADQLAQMPQLSSRYVSLASARFSLTANQFFPVQNSPAMGTLGNATSGANRTAAMLFDASAFETVSATIIMPIGWATFSTHLWWANAGAGAGDVTWVHYNDQFSDTDTTDAAPAGTFVTSTAGLQYVLVRSSFSGTTSATAGQLVRLNIARSATSGSDTLANDAGLVAVELVRAS